VNGRRQRRKLEEGIGLKWQREFAQPREVYQSVSGEKKGQWLIE